MNMIKNILKIFNKMLIIIMLIIIIVYILDFVVLVPFSMDILQILSGIIFGLIGLNTWKKIEYFKRLKEEVNILDNLIKNNINGIFNGSDIEINIKINLLFNELIKLKQTTFYIIEQNEIDDIYNKFIEFRKKCIKKQNVVYWNDDFNEIIEGVRNLKQKYYKNCKFFYEIKNFFD